MNDNYSMLNLRCFNYEEKKYSSNIFNHCQKTKYCKSMYPGVREGTFQQIHSDIRIAFRRNNQFYIHSVSLVLCGYPLQHCLPKSFAQIPFKPSKINMYLHVALDILPVHLQLHVHLQLDGPFCRRHN